MLNGATFLRRELMIRIVRAFDEGTLATELDQIPIKLRPKDSPASRCCVYHDRAVLNYRLMALLGLSVEDETDEAKQKELVHQLTDLALLGNGLLKGEALSKFLKRSVEMI